MKIQYRIMDLEGGTAKLMWPIKRELEARGHVIDVVHERAHSLSTFEETYDLVHCWNISESTAEIGRRAKKLLVTVHHIPLQHEAMYIAKLKATKADRVHVVDPWAIRQLGRYGIYNVNLILQAIDRKYNSEPMPEEFTIGYVGNSESGLKRFDLIEEAARELGIRCVGHKNPPWVSDKIIEMAYKMMSCYVCASYEEGGPIPVLEALQMGRPVVTVPVGNAGLFVKPGVNGEFFEGDIDSLCEAIERVREGLDWYSKNAAETPLSPPAMVAQLYERLYEEVIDARQG